VRLRDRLAASVVLWVIVAVVYGLYRLALWLWGLPA